MYEQPRRDLGLCGYSFVRYSEKCFARIYRALYGDAFSQKWYEFTTGDQEIDRYDWVYRLVI